MATSAAALAAAAVVADALTALDSDEPAPASLRATSVTLALCLSAPLVVNPQTLNFGLFQRPVLLGLLVVVSVAGRHTGGSDVRAADGFFTLLALGAAIHLFCSGGVDSKAKKTFQRDSDPCVPLFAALLAYASARVLRASLFSPLSVLDFEHDTAINGTTFQERGYAYADDAAAIAGCVVGGIGLAVSVLIFIDIGDKPRLGTVGAIFLILLASVTLTLATGSSINESPQVFAYLSCTGDICEASRLARRLAVVNNPAPQAWLLLAALVVYFGDETALGWTLRFAFGLVGFVAGVVIVYAHASFEGDQEAVDYAVLGLCITVGFGVAFGSPGVSHFAWTVAAALTLRAAIMDMGASTVLSDPFRFNTLIMTILGISYFALDLLRTCFKMSAVLFAVTSAVFVTATALSVMGFLIGILLGAAYDGSDFVIPYDGNRAMMLRLFYIVAPAVFHTSTFLVEKRFVFPNLMRWLWLLSPAAGAALHAITLAAMGQKLRWVTVPLPGDSWPVASAAVAAGSVYVLIGA